MSQCYVSNCNNYYGKTRGNNIIYHMVPTDPELLSKWVRACRGGKEPPPSHAKVCSEHFSENCYQRDLQHELLGLPLRKKLKYGAVPDLKLPPKNSKQKKQVLKAVDCQNQVRKDMQTAKIKVIKKVKRGGSLDSALTEKKPKNTTRNNSCENISFKNKNLLEKLQEQVSFLDGINIEAVSAKNTKLQNFKNRTKVKKKSIGIVNKQPDVMKAVANVKHKSKTDANKLTKSDNNNVGIVSNKKVKDTKVNIIDLTGCCEKTNQEVDGNKNDEKDNKNRKITKENVENGKLNQKKIEEIPKLKKIIQKFKRRPMRSSIRIAKKKSIESLSDSFTEKINSKTECNKRELFTDKLKFMAKLELKHGKNNKQLVIDLDHFFDGITFDTNR